jgi:RNA polymerase sigma-70 factor (ECF subfamily)
MDALRSRPRWESVDSLEWIGEPDDDAPESLLEEHVRQTILRLKPEYRAVLVLFYFQQLSYSEMADTLQCSSDQVRIRLHRARKAFRLLYGDGGETVEM